jgi:hypothetical protein
MQNGSGGVRACVCLCFACFRAAQTQSSEGISFEQWSSLQSFQRRCVRLDSGSRSCYLVCSLCDVGSHCSGSLVDSVLGEEGDSAVIVKT